jgi:hypothetical protein
MIAEAARSAGIPYRIGSSSRFFHLWTCNHRPLQFRKLSKLHEAQLNILLLRPLIGDVDANCDELGPLLGFDRFRQFPSVKQYLDRNRFNLILHPRSNGHSKNWDPRHFAKLIDLLPKDRYNIIVTGNQDERREIGPLLLDPYAGLIQDTMGRLSVPELISLCSQADGLVSNSTGPLHVAAGAGIHALGLYNYAYKTRPSRYGPIGPRAETLIYDENCPTCLANKGCDCINLISPERCSLGEAFVILRVLTTCPRASSGPGLWPSAPADPLRYSLRKPTLLNSSRRQRGNAFGSRKPPSRSFRRMNLFSERKTIQPITGHDMAVNTRLARAEFLFIPPPMP